MRIRMINQVLLRLAFGMYDVICGSAWYFGAHAPIVFIYMYFQADSVMSVLNAY